jgi:hypothetical protein
MRRDATLTMSEVKLSQFRTIIGRMLVTVQRGSFFWSIDSNSSSIFTYDEENFEPRFLVQFDKDNFDNFECSFNVTFTVNDLKQFFGVISSCVSGKVECAYTRLLAWNSILTLKPRLKKGASFNFVQNFSLKTSQAPILFL